MSKISFLGFGGLNEKDKPCYAISINGEIYLFDCGLSTPINAQLGVKKIIPDFNWIIQNANQVKGIFIGTPKYNNYAALPYLIKYIPKLQIYTSDVGATIIINYFNRLAMLDKDLTKRPNIKILNTLTPHYIGNVTITPFYISNYLPKSLGFVINTPDGGITFIDDFMISSNRNLAFEDQLNMINNITKSRNLALIVGCGNIDKNSGFTNPSHRTVDFFSDILSENLHGRTLIACHDYDLYTITTIANICALKNRPFIIYSGSTNRVFQFLCNKGYFRNNRLKVINELSMNKTANAVIIISGNPERLIKKVESILNEEDPKLKILPTDYFVYATHTVNGYEKMEAQMFDHIVRSNAKKIIKLPKNIILAAASAEDHKYLIDLLRPKYSIPVNGLYMNMVQYRNAVSLSFMKKENVIILENGQEIEFNQGQLQKNTKNHKLLLQFVNSTGAIDSGNASIFEREIMAKDGIVTVNLIIDKKAKKIIRYSFEPVGVINFTEENKKMINEINLTILKLVGEYLLKNIKSVDEPLNTKEFKYYLRKLFNKYYFKKFEKQPLVVPSLIFKKW